MESKASPEIMNTPSPAATSEVWLNRYAYHPQAFQKSVTCQGQPAILLEHVPALLRAAAMR